MKTIFISSFHPLISRNILSTGVLEKLSEKARVVILAPDFKKEYFIKEFGGENIFVEGVDMSLSAADLFFRRVVLALSSTKALYIKKRSQFYRDGKIMPFLGYVLPSFLGRFTVAVKVLRFFDYYFFRTDFFGDLFNKYQPDLIFSADAQNELDVRLMKEGRRTGLKILSMVRSWDNLTSKGILRFVPDALLTNNGIVKSEAVRYSFISLDKLKIVGIPHYDKYFNAATESKSDFFSRFGFDMQKALVIYAPIGNRYIRNNQTDKHALEILSSLDINILVRMPPTDEVNFEGFQSDKATVFFQKTGNHSDKGGKKLSEITQEDERSLVSALFHASVIVTGQSTITIDACAFDKPVVIVGFDKKERSYWDSMRRYYDYEYYKPILKSGGVSFVASPTELLDFTKKYLADSSLHREGRKKIIKMEAEFLDGKSTERLADVLLSYL